MKGVDYLFARIEGLPGKGKAIGSRFGGRNDVVSDAGRQPHDAIRSASGIVRIFHVQRHAIRDSVERRRVTALSEQTQGEPQQVKSWRDPDRLTRFLVVARSYHVTPVLHEKRGQRFVLIGSRPSRIFLLPTVEIVVMGHEEVESEIRVLQESALVGGRHAGKVNKVSPRLEGVRSPRSEPVLLPGGIEEYAARIHVESGDDLHAGQV